MLKIIYQKIRPLLFVLFILLLAYCQDEKITPLIPESVVKLSDSCELLSFGFNKEQNSKLTENKQADIAGKPDTLYFHFLHFTDLSALIASFEISRGASMLIDTIVQISDTTSNNFFELVNYTVLAENDTNKYEFCVKTSYPLLFGTIGYSGDTVRVGAGDFDKEELFSVSNLPDGVWEYELEIDKFSCHSTVLVEGNSFIIPNFLSKEEWLNFNDGADCAMSAILRLSSEALNITDSTFHFSINREQYVIRSWQDLQCMNYDLAGHYTMEKDVYFPLPGTHSFPEEGFSPIGDSLKMPFTGSFDGKDHVIYDFFIRRFSDTVRYIGLFGVIERKMDRIPIIKNVGIEIAGREERGGLSGGWYSGGIAGWNEGKIINCYVKGDIFSDSPSTEPGGSGGLAGCNWGGEIERCSAFGGKVTANVKAGGLVGENASGGKISRSCSRQQVVLTGIPVYPNQTIAGGGLVGENSTSSEIINCYATGSVSGRENIGGFVGRHATISTIRLSYASGKVIEINNTNSITVGGFAGEIYGQPDRRSVTDCYWGTAANPGLDGVGEGAITGIDGASDEDFSSKSTFIGWDFTYIWDINSSYNNNKAYLVDVKGQAD